MSVVKTLLLSEFICLLCFIWTTQSATFIDCRKLLQAPKPLYRRRVQQQGGPLLYVETVRYPDIVIDRKDLRNPQVITCIQCKDLNQSDPEGSQCKIVAGGVGYTFVKFKIIAQPHHGFVYDISVYGQDL